MAELCRSIARRVGAMAGRVGAEPPAAFGGGMAKNVRVVRALEAVLGESLIVPEKPQIVGALGAALLARDGGQQSADRPFDASVPNGARSAHQRTRTGLRHSRLHLGMQIPQRSACEDADSSAFRT